MAQLELMNALNSIRSEAELNEFKDLVARYFAEKAQKANHSLPAGKTNILSSGETDW